MRRLPLLLSTALVASCGKGAQEQVDFAPECAPGDLTCQTGGALAPLAVGAVLPLDIDVTIPGSASPSLSLESAAPEVLKVSGNEITGMNPGVSALLAITDGDLVIDFTHVFVTEPTRIALHRTDGGDAGSIDGPIELLVGDEITAEVVPYADGTRLRGRADATWTVSSDAVLALADGAIGRRRLVARAAGSTELEVSAMGHTTIFDLEVLP